MASETSAVALKASAVRERVVALRLKGASYSAIARALGISTTAAFGHVKRAMKDANEHAMEDATVMRTVELMRLDRMELELWDKAITSAKQGGPDLPTVDRVLKIMERRAKLLGLDAPEVQGGDADVIFKVYMGMDTDKV